MQSNAVDGLYCKSHAMCNDTSLNCGQSLI